MSNHGPDFTATEPTHAPANPSFTPAGITYDAIYYWTVGFFALLTTALPTALGQRNFLPIIQTLGLTVFLAIPLTQRNPKGAVRVMVIWLVLQYLILTLLAILFNTQVERAIPDGFAFRGAISTWFYGNGEMPSGLLAEPAARLREIAGVVLGGLATAGLVGSYFLMRGVNETGYATGSLIISLEQSANLLRAIPYWSLFRLAGLGGLLVLCAEPLLTYQWSPLFYWRARRRLLLISAGLLLLGLLLELFLPGLIRFAPPT